MPRHRHHTQQRLRRRVVLLVGLAAALVTLFAASSPALASGPVLTRYSVGGNPMMVAVQGTGHVWFTMPASDAIGELTLDGGGGHQVDTYPIWAGSQPFDVAYADGYVWFTMRGRSAIGRLNATTGEVTEFPFAGDQRLWLPLACHGATLDAQGSPAAPVPAARKPGSRLAVVPGEPTKVYFTREQDANLWILTVHGDGTSSCTHVAPPVPYGVTALNDVAYADGCVWLTAPEESRLFNYTVSTGQFSHVYTNAGSRPWALALGSTGAPWFTDVGLNRIGAWSPSTLSIIYSRAIPTADSVPLDLTIHQGYVWFTEYAADRAGRTSLTDYQDMEDALLAAGLAPVGIAPDPEGMVWIALSGTSEIGYWVLPFVN